MRGFALATLCLSANLGLSVFAFHHPPAFIRPSPQATTRTCQPLSFARQTLHDTALQMSLTDEYMLDANNLELLQTVFEKYDADKDGLMTKVDVTQVPAIAQMLKDGDLLADELSEIWEGAPKFPDGNEDRIDVDSFVQLYRAIDNLFEEDEEAKPPEKPSVQPTYVATKDESSSSSLVPEEASELFEIFASIAKDGALTKEQLKKWDETETLIADGMLGQDEFEKLWKDSCADDGASMDEAGFLQFNDLLDSLFDFDDVEADDDLDDIIEDLEEDKVDPVEFKGTSKAFDLVEGDIAPEELFSLLKSEEGVVGVPQLKRWGELQEMIADEEILPGEVDDFFEKALEISKVDGALDQAGFVVFSAMIDDLFEEDEEGGTDDDEVSRSDETVGSSSLKEDLLRALNVMNNDEDRLPCGLESTEREQKLILDLVTEMEKENTNLLRIKQGNVEPSDLSGEWEMLYTSSSAMKFNKGLSGLGGSFPNGKFGGLKQTLKSTAVMSDVEYSEFIDVNPSASSFDVKIDGNWDLRRSTSLFTGDPSIVLSVEPNRVTYGPTSTRADHWKSLGPMNMLDVTYLDDEIRIMRGNTAVDTVFIFKRLK